MSQKEINKIAMVEKFEKELPDFAEMIKTTEDETIMIHQDAFAADFQEMEFKLLGMAIKYAGIYGRQMTVIPSEELETNLECPNCKKIATVYHFEWSSIKCQDCGGMIEKQDWKIVS